MRAFLDESNCVVIEEDRLSGTIRLTVTDVDQLVSELCEAVLLRDSCRTCEGSGMLVYEGPNSAGEYETCPECGGAKISAAWVQETEQ